MCNGCDSTFKCLKCPGSKLLNPNGECLDTCPVGHFGQDGKCNQCPQNSLDCFMN